MLKEYQELLDKLKQLRWTIQLRPSWRGIPSEIKERYPWIPTDIEQFVGELELAATPDEKAWLLGAPDYLGTSSSAFKWNEWERLTLDVAGSDLRWAAEIKRFWDFHFPVAMSVKSGYAFFAINKAGLNIVCGEEPEFEETTVVAPSFLEFLRLVAEPDGKLSRWI
jgi:hypothetical protein